MSDSEHNLHLAGVEPEEGIAFTFVCSACHKTYKFPDSNNRDCPKCQRKMKIIEPAAELRTARMLMLMGLVPFILGIVLVCAMFVSARTYGGGMTEALAGLFILAASYIITLLAAGSGALWTRSILRKQGSSISNSADVLSKIVLVVVSLPILIVVAHVVNVYLLKFDI